MSTTHEVLRRHRNLTIPINTRVSKDLNGDVVKTAKRLRLSRSAGVREALAKWVEANKPTT